MAEKEVKMNGGMPGRRLRATAPETPALAPPLPQAPLRDRSRIT